MWFVWLKGLYYCKRRGLDLEKLMLGGRLMILRKWCFFGWGFLLYGFSFNYSVDSEGVVLKLSLVNIFLLCLKGGCNYFLFGVGCYGF